MRSPSDRSPADSTESTDGPQAARPIRPRTDGLTRSGSHTQRHQGVGIPRLGRSSTAFPEVCAPYSSQDRAARVNPAMADDVSPASRRPARGGRVPPHNLQAEESLLGAMLLEAEAIATAAEACCGPTTSTSRPTPTSSTPSTPSTPPASRSTRSPWPTSCGATGCSTTVGGHQVLVDIRRRRRPPRTPAGYARIVEEHALLRRLIGVAGEIAEIGYGMPDDVAKALDRAESMVFDVNQRRVTDTTAKIEDLLGLNLDRLEQLYGRGDAITGVPTGYVDLDELLSGLQPSTLVVVGGRPVDGQVRGGRHADRRPRDRRAAHRRRAAPPRHRRRRGRGADPRRRPPRAHPAERVRRRRRQAGLPGAHPHRPRGAHHGQPPVPDPGRVAAPGRSPPRRRWWGSRRRSRCSGRPRSRPTRSSCSPTWSWRRARTTAAPSCGPRTVRWPPTSSTGGRASGSRSPTARCPAAAAPGTSPSRPRWPSWPGATASRPRWRPAGCPPPCSAWPRELLARFLNRALGARAAVWRPQHGEPGRLVVGTRSAGAGPRPAAPAAAVRHRRRR